MKDEALRLALDKKADNARDLGLNYDPENTLHWHALNYRTAPTQNAQEMFEALEKFVETAIKQALEQPEPVIDHSAAVRIATALGWEPKRKPEPEPVALGHKEKDKYEFVPTAKWFGELPDGVHHLYTSPPKREWQGLTDVDVSKILDEQNGFYTFEKCFNFAKAIEAKLKEKNHDSR
jgi:hypothetical protein